MEFFTFDQIRQKLHIFLRTAKKPVIVVLGPTASGKTKLSTEIARNSGSQTAALRLSNRGYDAIEIINADSRQLYKYLDIGTAKITEREMGSIPHHLFSVLDPKQEVSIAWYQKEATRIIDEIHARNRIPMLVGGSMLYISSVIDGLDPIEKSDPVLRKKLSEEYDRDGGVALHKKLMELDPESAQGIPIQNKMYLLRACEICLLTGEPRSAQKKKTTCPYDLFIIGVSIDRAVLRKRINERTEKMLKSGWIEEVQSLLERDYTIDDPGMQSVGYREIGQWLKNPKSSVRTGWPGGQASTTKQSPNSRFQIPDSFFESIAAQTRRYAKRQMTWWKNDPRIHWVQIYAMRE